MLDYATLKRCCAMADKKYDTYTVFQINPWSDKEYALRFCTWEDTDTTFVAQLELDADCGETRILNLSLADIKALQKALKALRKDLSNG